MDGVLGELLKSDVGHGIFYGIMEMLRVFKACFWPPILQALPCIEHICIFCLFLNTFLILKCRHTRRENDTLHTISLDNTY